MLISQPQTTLTPPAGTSQPQLALAKLTPIQKKAMYFRQECLTFAEIGVRLGCTEGAALDIIRRASARLKQAGAVLPESLEVPSCA